MLLPNLFIHKKIKYDFGRIALHKRQIFGKYNNVLMFQTKKSFTSPSHSPLCVFLLLADHALDLLWKVYISFYNNWIKLEGIIVDRKGVKNLFILICHRNIGTMD
jgi:hypothetical protein